MTMHQVVYFSNASENTKRFVEKLDVDAVRIPLNQKLEIPQVDKPFVLITPTYGTTDADSGIPKQVIKFLNLAHNRALLKGVIASGNTNFGSKYCYAGKLVADKCNVPLLYKFELIGTKYDVEMVTERMENLWTQF